MFEFSVTGLVTALHLGPQGLYERVHKTVSRFLCQAVHEHIMIPREES
jgi:hypothetical protein